MKLTALNGVGRDGKFVVLVVIFDDVDRVDEIMINVTVPVAVEGLVTVALVVGNGGVSVIPTVRLGPVVNGAVVFFVIVA